MEFSWLQHLTSTHVKKTQARCLCHSYGKEDGAVVLNVLCLVIPCVCFDDCGRPLNAIGNMGRESGDEDLGKAAAKERERCTWQRDNRSRVADKRSLSCFFISTSVLSPTYFCLCVSLVFMSYLLGQSKFSRTLLLYSSSIVPPPPSIFYIFILWKTYESQFIQNEELPTPSLRTNRPIKDWS